MTVTEVARKVGVSRKSVLVRIHAGKLAAKWEVTDTNRHGGTYAVDPASVTAWLRERATRKRRSVARAKREGGA